MSIKRVILALGLLLGAAQLSIVHGQLSTARSSNHSTLFGIGRASHLDTYLTPAEYQGPQLTYLHETLRSLQRNEHVIFQTLTQGDFSYAHNQAETGHELGGSVCYDFGWGRRWTDMPWKGLSLTAMGLAGGHLGFLYNDRNTNNPAQAHATLHLTAALRADYRFKIKKRTLALSYQAHLPLLGTAFMPQYGQSYYDIFDRGHYDHNLVCTHPGNALSLRQIFSIDIPIRRSTLRLGYLSDLRQLKANDIKQHQYSRSFMIGYVRNISLSR